MDHQVEQEARKNKPSSCLAALPRLVLWLGFAFFSLAGWTRMIYAISNWYWLNVVGIRFGPLYQAISGGAWGLVGLAALAWVILRRPWYRLVGTSAALFFALTYWLDRLVVVISPDSGANAAFAAGLTVFDLAFVLLALRPFGELQALIKREYYGKN
jgi:hypothetical protein